MGDFATIDASNAECALALHRTGPASAPTAAIIGIQEISGVDTGIGRKAEFAEQLA